MSRLDETRDWFVPPSQAADRSGTTRLDPATSRLVREAASRTAEAADAVRDLPVADMAVAGHHPPPGPLSAPARRRYGGGHGRRFGDAGPPVADLRGPAFDRGPGDEPACRPPGGPLQRATAKASVVLPPAAGAGPWPSGRQFTAADPATDEFPSLRAFIESAAGEPQRPATANARWLVAACLVGLLVAAVAAQRLLAGPGPADVPALPGTDTIVTRTHQPPATGQSPASTPGSASHAAPAPYPVPTRRLPTSNVPDTRQPTQSTAPTAPPAVTSHPPTYSPPVTSLPAIRPPTPVPTTTTPATTTEPPATTTPPVTSAGPSPSPSP
jgi:hypothetical protein